jgi:hypothetical protein
MSTSKEKRQEAQEVLGVLKFGTLLPGVLSFAACVSFPYRIVWILGGALAYTSYELFTVLDNLQSMYESKTKELTARFSKNNFCKLLTERAPVSRMLLPIFIPDDYSHRFFW